MSILVSNDDGIDAPGLAALEMALSSLGVVHTLAPMREQSAQSHALTLHKPLRVRERGERRWAVSGTPADCVYLGLSHFATDARVVVSGVNNGANLGSDVFYSGTVAAAREACLHGVAAIAVSLYRTDRSPPQWDTAARVAERVTREVLARGLDAGLYLNVNVPNVPFEDLKGIKTTVLGQRNYEKNTEVRTDPRGRHYYWVGGPHLSFDGADDADGVACAAGWASVSPFELDLTSTRHLASLREWTDA